MPRFRTVCLGPIARWSGLGFAAALLLVLSNPPSPAAELLAGDYSFSDRLGGFRLLSASGSGSSTDPVVIVEEIDDAAPVTLIVRRQVGSRLSKRQSFASLTLEKVVVNRSIRIWAGFEIELQEVLKRPSVYSDGLSFNQLAARIPDVDSDTFAEAERLFEPADRIRFSDGFVNPEGTARFRITITDPTPDLEFYIVQDPKLLSAGRKPVTSFAARLP